MLCAMRRWTSPKKHWSCFVMMRAQVLSRSHLNHRSSRMGDSFAKFKGSVFRPAMGEQLTWPTTASLSWYRKQQLPRSSCKGCKVVFLNGGSPQSSSPSGNRRTNHRNRLVWQSVTMTVPDLSNEEGLSNENEKCVWW